VKRSTGSNADGPGVLAGGYSIRRQLLILAVVLIVPAALAGTILLTYTYSKERDASALQLQTTARALSIVVDRQLGQAEALLQALATAPSLIGGDFEAFDRQARQANQTPDSWIVVRDGTGRQLVNTRLPWGAQLPVDTNVSTQRSFLLAGGPHISNLVQSPQVGPVVGIDIPVMRDGVMLYELAIVIRPSAFDRVFHDQRMPPEWIGVIIDRAGLVVRRSRDSEATVGHPISQSFKAKLDAGTSEDVHEGISLEGEPMVSAYSRSRTSAWTFSVAIPRDTLGSAARRSLYLEIVFGVMLIAGGGLAARRIADGIARPIEGLVGHAAALGRGEPGLDGQTGLAEADLVANAMRDAGRSIRSFTTTLEDRVAERTRDLAEANRRLSAEIEEREKAEAQLARVQRMEAIGQLSGGVAHDFNNLLQAVVGNIDLAKRRITEPRAQRFLEHALAAADRGAKLTGQLLAFSRKQRLAPAPVDIGALISNLIDILPTTIGEGVDIETQIAGDLWPAIADAAQLELAVLNLAINARDAMPNGGMITVSVSNVVRAAPVRAEEPPTGDYVEIAVSDTGSGIAPEDLGKVFEPFFTTKEVGKGSGLGLSQVLGLAQQLGGGVIIDSTPGKGTSVRIYLPRAKGSLTSET
jgi:signal transduction histidine kinase